MRQLTGTRKSPGEKIVKDIKRATLWSSSYVGSRRPNSQAVTEIAVALLAEKSLLISYLGFLVRYQRWQIHPAVKYGPYNPQGRPEA